MPTEKRQRQKQGRQARLAAQRKVDKRRQLVRRTVIVVVIAGVVIGSVLLFTRNNSRSSSATTTTTTTLPIRTVTPSDIAATKAANQSINTIVSAQEQLTAAQRSAAQTAANNVATAAGCPASTKARVNTLQWSSPPKMTINTSAMYRAIVTTTIGTFTIKLDAKAAPVTVNNFIFLARKGYYRCVIFHRVIPTFMNQTGDPTGLGSGSPGYTIPDENPPKASIPAYQYAPGAVAMANTGSPNTGGAQFFIITGTQGEGLPNTYALFGQVISGINVVATINGQGSAAGIPPDVTQRMLSIKIVGPS